jgi:hypothetical protein
VVRRGGLEQGVAADERAGVELHEAPSPISNGVLLRFDQRLLAAVEVDVDQQETGLDACDVEGEHAGRVDVERASAKHQGVPDRDGTVHGIQIS